jgi:hypothetical protein
MSSKEQLKDALKRDKQLISDLKKEIQSRDLHIKLLQDELALKTKTIRTKDKNKWWQFWKIKTN